MTEYNPALVERMVALVRKAADGFADENSHGSFWCEVAIDADAIVAELRAPVDPDLAIANELAEQFGWDRHDCEKPGDLLWEGSGAALALAAIKRVRAEQRA
jgi:hypothetical protein